VRDLDHVCHLKYFMCGTSLLSAQFNSTFVAQVHKHIVCCCIQSR